MSPEQLAVLLSECAKDSPQYILIEHELALRIAKVQSRAAYAAAFFGLGGVVVGAFLTNWLQPPQQSQPPQHDARREPGPASDKPRAGVAVPPATSARESLNKTD
jgi:hypothetical protein